jgi:hypothetical protein
MNATETVLIVFIIICIIQFIALGRMFGYIEKLRVENYAIKAKNAIDSALGRNKNG